LELAGTDVRYVLADGERAVDFALAATTRALAAAELVPSEVDFAIYAGVKRGFIEPAMANVIQAAAGLTNATCFDVLDGCASWTRALHVAHAFLRGGAYRRGIIVNCECGLTDYGDWEIGSIEESEYRFAALTIGEAATATVVVESDFDDFYFRFQNYGEHVDKCVIPLPNMADCIPTATDVRYVPLRFFSLSRELVSIAGRKVVEVFESDRELPRRSYDLCFGHAASEKINDIIGKKLRIPRQNYFPTHPGYGNTVAAAVPLAMSLALEERRLRRGDKVLVIVGSAGITVGFAAFTF
jgi:3-oxoacyl-[acyl-carrier-protein] synthase III